MIQIQTSIARRTFTLATRPVSVYRYMVEVNSEIYRGASRYENVRYYVYLSLTNGEYLSE